MGEKVYRMKYIYMCTDLKHFLFLLKAFQLILECFLMPTVSGSTTCGRRSLRKHMHYPQLSGYLTVITITNVHSYKQQHDPFRRHIYRRAVELLCTGCLLLIKATGLKQRRSKTSLRKNWYRLGPDTPYSQITQMCR